MSTEFLTDAARILAIILNVAILVILQRALHIKGSTWTMKMMGLFRFVNTLMIFLLVVSITKITIDAGASLTPFGQVLIYSYGIRVLLKKGGYEK